MTWEFFSSYEHLKQLGITIGIFLLFLLLRKLFTKYVFALILKLTRKTPSKILPDILLAFKKPIELLFIIIGLYLGLFYYPYFDSSSYVLYGKIIRVSVIALITWGAINLFSKSSNFFTTFNKITKLQIEEILFPMLSKAIQFVIFTIGLSVILQEFDYQISGLITGLGIGGLAVSLAAQTVLSNFFGGIVIITEKPFIIDDWIETPSVEGTVEEISFRSTKVRTFAHALVVVPNATLANEPITNWSKMGKRRISFHVTIAYDTPQTKISTAVEQIEKIIKEHEGIDQDTILVKAENFTENGIDILFYFFTKTTAWSENLKIREEINLEILKILEDLEIEIAIPYKQLFENNSNA